MSHILVRYKADNRLEIRKRRKERVSETHFYTDENGESLKAVVLNCASLMNLEKKKQEMENAERILVKEEMSPVEAQEKGLAKGLEGRPMKRELRIILKRIESPMREHDRITVKTEEESPTKRKEGSVIKAQNESPMEEQEMRRMKRPERSAVRKQRERAAKEQKEGSGSEWEEYSEDRSYSEWEESSEDKSVSDWEENSKEEEEKEEKEKARSKKKKVDTKDRHRAHYCLFCRKKIKRINYHLKEIHKNETEVKKIMGTKDRGQKLLMWKILVAKGDSFYNKKVLEGQGGELITAIMKNDPNTTKKMTTCENCWSIQKTTHMRVHRKICYKKGRSAEKPPAIYENLTDDGFYEEVVRDMKRGFPNLILNNPLFYSFGRALWTENGFKSSKPVKQKLRYLKSLEEELQGEEKNKDIRDFLHPKWVDHVVTTIKKMAGFQRKNRTLVIEVPSKVRKLIDLVREVASHERSNALKSDDETRAKQINNFIVVFEDHRTCALRRVARDYMEKMSEKKVEDLPSMDDVWIITRHLEEEAAALLNKLKNSPDQETWMLLRDNLVIWSGLFNRRRGGASEHLKLADYYRARQISTKDLKRLKNPTEEELNFLKSLLVAEIYHKNHVVQLYIPQLLQEALKVFVAYRWVAGISEENEYVFAAVNDSLRPVRATNVFTKYRNLLPPESRHKMTFTNLRKQGATLVRVLDLDNEDLENWALHLGHTRLVQEKYYTLKGNPESVLKNGKILSLLRNGSLRDHVGKKLDDIPMELDTELPNPERNIGPQV